jgi:hypothetical protein
VENYLKAISKEETGPEIVITPVVESHFPQSTLVLLSIRQTLCCERITLQMES